MRVYTITALLGGNDRRRFCLKADSYTSAACLVHEIFPKVLSFAMSLPYHGRATR